LLVAQQKGLIYLFNLLVGVPLALSLTYLLRILAPKVGLLDRAGLNRRKIHSTDKPVAGFALPLIFFIQFSPFLQAYFSLALGILAVSLMGLIDDYQPLSARLKLLIQSLSAFLLVAFVHPPTFLGLGVQGVVIDGWFNLLFLACWTVGVTNSLNLVDGLDGLAPGLSLIGSAGLTSIALLGGSDPSLIALLGILTGSLLGFLCFNFNPAKVFLGDGGAYFLGLILAYLTPQVLSTSVSGGVASSWPLLPGLLILGVPLFDTAWAIVRRTVSGSGIMVSDERHIHHLLLEKLDHRKAVLTLYLSQALLSAGAVFFWIYFFG